MKNLKNLFVPLLFLITPLSMISGQVKVAHIEVQKLISEMPEVIAAQKELKKLGQSLIVRIGSVTEIFNELSTQFNIISIYAHEETGNQWTYDRDLNVKNWSNQKNIPLIEYPTNGIVRNLKNRDNWSKIRNLRMKEKDLAKLWICKEKKPENFSIFVYNL